MADPICLLVCRSFVNLERGTVVLGTFRERNGVLTMSVREHGVFIDNAVTTRLSGYEPMDAASASRILLGCMGRDCDITYVNPNNSTVGGLIAYLVRSAPL